MGRKASAVVTPRRDYGGQARRRARKESIRGSPLLLSPEFARWYIEKILVTGATGFSGCEVAKQLSQKGYKPRLMVRRPLRARVWARRPVHSIASIGIFYPLTGTNSRGIIGCACNTEIYTELIRATKGKFEFAPIN